MRLASRLLTVAACGGSHVAEPDGAHVDGPDEGFLYYQAMTPSPEPAWLDEAGHDHPANLVGTWCGDGPVYLDASGTSDGAFGFSWGVSGHRILFSGGRGVSSYRYELVGFSLTLIDAMGSRIVLRREDGPAEPTGDHHPRQLIDTWVTRHQSIQLEAGGRYVDNEVHGGRKVSRWHADDSRLTLGAETFWYRVDAEFLSLGARCRGEFGYVRESRVQRMLRGRGRSKAGRSW
jgi:hypothetical protein